jgi:regulator of protease activity HflC (stomatin/prohibitin superfamily)
MTVLGIAGLVISAIVIPVLVFIFADWTTAIIVALILTVFYLSLSIKIIIEYDRGLLFQLGKYNGILNPGFNLILPVIENIVRVTLRIQVADVPPQEIISRDNVPLNINAVAYYRVEYPETAILNVENYKLATFQIAQTTIRAVVGQHEMDEILIERDKINSELQRIIDEGTNAWGIKVTQVELKDVELPQNLKRTMAKQAEAERERRARVILAMGELEASEKLAAAGEAMTKNPGTLQLRLFQTMQEISAEKNSTILFPFPIDFAEFLNKMAKK